ncbi:Signal transduction histidine kinase [Streptomyces sp. 2224.1]|nr:signal transduction histidine kinase [Streptomyces sp. 2321.6]SDR42917.1 Signal transduction histidine kinase [Streptomyces sp. KS_16]SEC08398.1 Signal transduction histidine kinase [Streptomyces sp. 2224.1]SEC94670.1 Signal transduction histidine kinase [Streptomyces sp. 2133.1]SEE79317.1 Signal transduction histidine kinase [Streptomyces sp. 2112.3]SNC69459.1 Signal transduction histidine kinase [Streptomyces sp. 2114.4]
MGTPRGPSLLTFVSVNDTTQTQSHLRSEARIAHGALHRLRQDLFVGAFAFRPMPPLEDAKVSRWLPFLPQRLRHWARWLPHFAVGFFSVCVFLATLADADGGGSLRGLLVTGFSAVVAAGPLLTLFRPVGAYWLSLGAFVLSVLVYAGFSSPYVSVFGQSSFPTHLAVMVLVVLRTRPRLAIEMWLVTFATAAVITASLGREPGDVPPIAVFCGVVLACAAAIRAWREERRQVVETLTATAEERSRRTLLEERALIARELHDVVAHHMSVIAIQAEAAPYRVKDTPPELATSFATIRENAVAALAELRRILGVVRSADPDAFAENDPEAPQPTLASLDALLASVRSAGLTVEAVTTGAPRPLPQGVELSAYRIVQEGLSNALRHSPGAEARVEISYVLGGLGVRIVNGPPSRLAKPSPGAGHGVLGMRERVQMLGGEMTADHTEDGGFEVAAFLPVVRTAGENTVGGKA